MDAFNHEKSVKRLSLITKAAGAFALATAATWGAMSFKGTNTPAETPSMPDSQGVFLGEETQMAEHMEVKELDVASLAVREKSDCPMQYLHRVAVG